MYKGTLIAVTNMEESEKFYHDILDMNVVGDFGANVHELLEHTWGQREELKMITDKGSFIFLRKN